MIFVTPFFPAHTDYEKFSKALKSRGQCDGHSHLIVTQRQDEPAAIEFSKAVGKLFDSTTIKVIDAVVQGGLVAVSNALFKAAFYAFREDKSGATLPMLYGDPTWYPVKQGWLNAIQAEYFSKGMPRILSRFQANAKGEKITRGPVLMSRAYIEDAPLVPHIPLRTHWREYLRYEMGNVSQPSVTISTGDKAVLKFNKTAVAVK